MLYRTVIFITRDTVIFICPRSEAELLAPLATEPGQDPAPSILVKVLVKPKGLLGHDKIWRELLKSVEAVTSQSKQIGRIQKDKQFPDWLSFLKYERKEALLRDTTDISAGLSYILAPKPLKDLSPTNVTAARQADRSNKGWNGNFDSKDAILRFPPAVRSKGDDNFSKHSPRRHERIENTGVFSTALGIQSRLCCSSVGRTFMVDPHPSQQAYYSYLLELQRFALGELKDGLTANQFDALVKRKVKKEQPRLSLPNYFGTCMGNQMGDQLLKLGPKCFKVLKKDMVFRLSLAFIKIKGFERKYACSLRITDTVLIGKECWTILCDGLKDSSEVTFFLNSNQREFNQTGGAGWMKHSEDDGSTGNKDWTKNSEDDGPTGNEDWIKNSEDDSPDSENDTESDNHHRSTKRKNHNPGSGKRAAEGSRQYPNSKRREQNWRVKLRGNAQPVKEESNVLQNVDNTWIEFEVPSNMEVEPDHCETKNHQGSSATKATTHTGNQRKRFGKKKKIKGEHA
ncbi:hypothetical protein PCANC_20462 [Puccinia coronata f. sp. avenae]|uniref:FACT complex subunit n=1 Tax=Puccinia coronata f. sp. avenae TaxID=200324 RepID=A0A2N5U3Q0_9BASI|nr:hypothetical protein PCANC_20462 [Puccinia coronata f. sp. avenae]